MQSDLDFGVQDCGKRDSEDGLGFQPQHLRSSGNHANRPPGRPRILIANDFKAAASIRAGPTRNAPGYLHPENSQACCSSVISSSHNPRCWHAMARDQWGKYQPGSRSIAYRCCAIARSYCPLAYNRYATQVFIHADTGSRSCAMVYHRVRRKVIRSA